MTNPIIRIHNTEIDEVIDREMTDQEFAEYQLVAENAAAAKAEKEANVIAKAALLDRLGITAEEAKLLLS